MLSRSCCVVAGGLAAAALFGGVKSSPVAITRDADASLLYRTLTSEAFTLQWVMPEEATRATLTVTGDKGFSATYTDLSEPQQALELPARPESADAEQIFTFSLAFDSGETVSARVGAVCGIAEGADTEICRCRTEGSRKWTQTSRREVVPVASGLQDISLAVGSGTPQAVDPGLDGAAGWMRLPLAEKGPYTLAARCDGVDFSFAFTYLPGGFTFIFR